LGSQAGWLNPRGTGLRAGENEAKAPSALLVDLRAGDGEPVTAIRERGQAYVIDPRCKSAISGHP